MIFVGSGGRFPFLFAEDKQLAEHVVENDDRHADDHFGKEPFHAEQRLIQAHHDQQGKSEPLQKAGQYARRGELAQLFGNAADGFNAAFKHPDLVGDERDRHARDPRDDVTDKQQNKLARVLVAVTAARYEQGRKTLPGKHTDVDVQKFDHQRVYEPVDDRRDDAENDIEQYLFVVDAKFFDFAQGKELFETVFDQQQLFDLIKDKHQLIHLLYYLIFQQF